MMEHFSLWGVLLLSVMLPVISAANAEPTPKPITPDCSMYKVKCEQKHYNTCLDVQLPFTHTSLVMAQDSNSQEDVQEKLDLWEGLRSVPRCWEVIQPLLCSVYMPRCDDEKNVLELPGVELCERTREPCKIVENSEGWPDFLKCDQPHFKENCVNEMMSGLSFNTTGECSAPLVPTENRNSWFQEVEGCGIPCENPLFSNDEHRRVHIFIAVCGSICMACTLFTILTFLIDWKHSSRYPAMILFFINCSYFVGSIGWMAQFLPGARDDIVCRSDGTWRQAEPQIGSGESASCTVIFVLVYFSMMSAITWFVILSYAWHLTFRAFGTPQDMIEGKRGHFHLIAWSIPLVLTIVCLAMTQVEGDSLSGICFVGYMNYTYRGCFVLLPVGIVICVGMSFLFSGLYTLIKMKLESPGLISDKASAKIREMIIRLGIFSSCALLFAIVTFIVHVYIFTNEPKWQEGFQDYVICETNVRVTQLQGNVTACELNTHPSLAAIQVNIFSYFGVGVIMSSWVWNAPTIRVWKKFFQRLRDRGKQESRPVKMRKHQVIAQAFSKRDEMHMGRLSLSFRSAYDDPLGMQFDLNSVSSHEMSSAWAAAIPRMIMRRGGLTHPALAGRRHSDSDFESVQSNSRRLSSEWRRCSIESQSQVSQASPASHISQVQQEQDDSSHRRKKRRKRRKRGRNRIIPSSTPSGGMSTDPGSWATCSSEARRGSLASGSASMPSTLPSTQAPSSSDTDCEVTPIPAPLVTRQVEATIEPLGRTFREQNRTHPRSPLPKQTAVKHQSFPLTMSPPGCVNENKDVKDVKGHEPEDVRKVNKGDQRRESERLDEHVNKSHHHKPFIPPPMTNETPVSAFRPVKPAEPYRSPGSDSVPIAHPYPSHPYRSPGPDSVPIAHPYPSHPWSRPAWFTPRPRRKSPRIWTTNNHAYPNYNMGWDGIRAVQPDWGVQGQQPWSAAMPYYPYDPRTAQYAEVPPGVQADLHTQHTTSTYSMFTASTCLPDVEAPPPPTPSWKEPEVSGHRGADKKHKPKYSLVNRKKTRTTDVIPIDIKPNEESNA